MVLSEPVRRRKYDNFRNTVRRVFKRRSPPAIVHSRPFYFFESPTRLSTRSLVRSKPRRWWRRGSVQTRRLRRFRIRKYACWRCFVFLRPGVGRGTAVVWTYLADRRRLGTRWRRRRRRKCQWKRRGRVFRFLARTLPSSSPATTTIREVYPPPESSVRPFA